MGQRKAKSEGDLKGRASMMTTRKEAKKKTAEKKTAKRKKVGKREKEERETVTEEKGRCIAEALAAAAAAEEELEWAAAAMFDEAALWGFSNCAPICHVGVGAEEAYAAACNGLDDVVWGMDIWNFNGLDQVPQIVL